MSPRIPMASQLQQTCRWYQMADRDDSNSVYTSEREVFGVRSSIFNYSIVSILPWWLTPTASALRQL